MHWAEVPEPTIAQAAVPRIISASGKAVRRAPEANADRQLTWFSGLGTFRHVACLLTAAWWDLQSVFLDTLQIWAACLHLTSMSSATCARSCATKCVSGVTGLAKLSEALASGVSLGVCSSPTAVISPDPSFLSREYVAPR